MNEGNNFSTLEAAIDMKLYFTPLVYSYLERCKGLK